MNETIKHGQNFLLSCEMKSLAVTLIACPVRCAQGAIDQWHGKAELVIDASSRAVHSNSAQRELEKPVYPTAI